MLEGDDDYTNGLTEPLMVETGSCSNGRSSHVVNNALNAFSLRYCQSNPEFFKQAFKLALCFLGLKVSYLTAGKFFQAHTTERAIVSKFSDHVLEVIVPLAAVRIRHGAFFANNKAPLLAFTPCALSYWLYNWSFVASFNPITEIIVIIPIMVIGKWLKGTNFPSTQYAEAVLITAGVVIFFDIPHIRSARWLYIVTNVFSISFTFQWLDKVCSQYGRANVDVYQMMLGFHVTANCIASVDLILSGDVPVLIEFFHAHPDAIPYNIISAILTVIGQLCLFYMIKEFGPIVFTIIMTTWKLFSVCLSGIVYSYRYGSYIAPKAVCGAILVFAVVFNKIRRYYNEIAVKHAVDRRGGSKDRISEKAIV